MRKIMLFATILFTACNNNDAQKQILSDHKIIEERINGPANVRDSINGKVIFTLNDNVLVACNPIEHDWYVVGLMMEIDTNEFYNDKIKKGRKIIVNNIECGSIVSDIEATTSLGKKQAWAHIIGYTHKNNIKPETIIEQVLHKKMKADQNRSLNAFNDFIENFCLQKDEQFEGYALYYNYESWISDPSPMWRIGLIFQNNMLVGLLHSRPINIEGLNEFKLNNSINCSLFSDTKNKEKIVDMFNKFMQSVD